MRSSYVVAMDIGGTNLRIGAVDERYEVRNFQKKPTRSVFTTQEPLADLSRCLHAYVAQTQIAGQIDAIVIGFPATINRQRTKVLQAANIPFMENLPVVEYLQETFKDVKILIERDVCLLMCCDMAAYRLADCEVLLGYYFGTGIGNVVCLNGSLYLGAHGVAGEAGHIPVAGNDEACGCGNRGCLENLAGGKYLAKLCRERFGDTPIQDLFVRHGKTAELQTFIDHMAIAVATEVNILDPDCVLIGGGVPNMKGFSTELLEKKIHEHTRKPCPEQDLKIIFVEDDDKKGVLGAAYLARGGRRNSGRL
jgi:allose kinase